MALGDIARNREFAEGAATMEMRLLLSARWESSVVWKRQLSSSALNVSGGSVYVAFSCPPRIVRFPLGRFIVGVGFMIATLDGLLEVRSIGPAANASWA